MVGTLLLLSQAASARPMLADANLAVYKADDPDPVIAGEPLTYVITVTNNGPDYPTNVILTDTLPSGVTYVSVTPSSRCNYDVASHIVTCTLFPTGTLGIPTATVNIFVNVAPSTTGTITNVAEVSATNVTDPNTSDNTFTETTTVNTEADLVIVKTGDPDPATAGQALTYTLTITNDGPSDATGVTITDTLPVSVSFGSASPGCDEVGGTITCAVGGLAYGNSTQVTITGTVDSSTAAGTITNTAGVTTTTKDPIPGNNTASETTAITTTADLAISKTGYPDPVIAGALLTYTLTVTNDGPSDATGVTVTDTLPVSLTFDSASPGCNEVGGTITCAVGGLAYGGNATVTVVVTPTVDVTVTNEAGVIADQSDPDTANNTATESTLVNPGADLVVTKSDDPNFVVAGAVLTYTLTITNDGPSNATGLIVTDTLPSDVSFGAATHSQGSCDESGGLVTCTLSSLAHGNNFSVVITVTVDPSVPDGTSLINEVSATATTADPDPSDNTDTESTAVTTEADMEIAKSDDPDPVTAGETLTYTLVITNHGPSDATGVTVTDTLPVSLTLGSATPSQGGCVGTTCNLNTIASGYTASVTITVTVAPSTTGQLSNSAGVSSNETDPVPGNDTAVEVTDVDTEADLEIVKTDDPDSVVAGAVLTYTLVITNHGPSDASGVTVADTLPTSVTFGSAIPSQGSCDGSGGLVTCTLDSLAYGDNLSVVVTVTVDPSALDGASLTNEAGVTATTGDPYVANNTDTEATTVHAETDLALAKSDDPDPVNAGDPLTYTLTITNYGPSDATGMTLTDTLPAEVTFDSASAVCSYTSPEHSVICNVGPLAVKATTTITAAVTVTSPLPNETLLANTAVVESDQTDPNDENDSAQTQTTVESAPIPSLTKSDGPDPVEAGAQLTYTLTYTNTGNEIATNTVITDILDENVTDFDADPPAQGTGRTRYWTIDDLAPDGPHRIHITVTVVSPLPNNTMLTNTAWLDTDQTAPLSTTQGTTVHSRPVLTMTKTDQPDPVNVGMVLRYTIFITNSGNENATSATVTEYYDPNVSFLFSNPSSGCQQDEDDVWTCPTLTVGVPEYMDVFVQVTGTLPVGTVLTNQATLDTDQTAPITATETTSTTSASELTVYKLDLPGNGVQAGKDLLYVINYLAGGTAPADDVIITETYDSRVTFISASRPPITGTNNVWDIGDLSINESGSFIVTVRVDTPLTNGVILTNVVTIDSADTSPKSYTETTSVSSAPDLAFSITDQPDPVEPGDPLTYTLRYTNTGNADATQVVVTATLDANTPYVSASPTPTGGADTVWYWEIGEIPGEGGYGEMVIHTAVTLPLPNGTILDFTAQLEDAEGDFLERTAQTTVSSAPGLHLHKSANASTVEAGDLLTYTLTYSNTGNETATNTVITDVLDSNVTLLGAWPTPDGGIAQHAPYWIIGHLTPTVVSGQIGQITLCVQVHSPLPNDTILTNTASIDSDQTVLSSTVESTTVRSAPILHLAKSDTPDPVDTSATLTYTLTYSNTGNETASNLVITDVLDPNVTFLSAWPTPDGGIAQHAPYWNIGHLPPDAPGQITLRVQVRSPLPNNTILTNTASIDCDQTAPSSTVEHTTVRSASILHLIKSDTPDPVDAGDLLTYTLTYSNTGNETATNTVITDFLDSNVTLLTAWPAPDGGTAQLPPYWTIGNLTPTAVSGQIGQIILRVQVHSPLPNNTILINTASIDCDQTVPSSTVEHTTVRSAPVIHLTKSDTPDPVDAGATLTYTITYSNTGSETTTNTVVTDVLDSNVTFLDAWPTPDGGIAQHTPYWIIGNLAPGAPGQITLRVQVHVPLPNNTVLTNTASIDSDQTVSYSVVENTIVESASALSLHKSDDVFTVYADDQLTYVLTYTNSGSENAYGVTITDTLPSYVEYVSCQIQGGNCQHVQSDGEVVFHIPTIVAQTSGQAQLIVRVSDPLPAGAAFVINHARMTAPSLPAPIDVQDVDLVGTRPDLAVAVDHAPSLFSPAKLMDYTVVYRNVGHMDAESVIITTILPLNTTYVGSGWDSSDGQTYTYTVGDLLAGASRQARFIVRYPDQRDIGVEEFNTPFTISGAETEDANPGDNTTHVYIGVPDLVVTEFTVNPMPVQPDMPITFTVVLENQGAGVARNPSLTGGPFWVDVFIAPVASYPWDRYSEKDIFAGPPALDPGAVYTIVLTHEGFSKQEMEEIQGFYVKVDNHADYLYGLVPESNEMNNLGEPISPIGPPLNSVYLPLVLRQRSD